MGSVAPAAAGSRGRLTWFFWPYEPGDPEAPRTATFMVRIELGFALSAMLVVPFASGLHGAEQDIVLACAAAFVLVSALAVLALSRDHPVLAWSLTTTAGFAAVLSTTLAIGGVVTAGILCYTILTLSVACVAGLRLGLVACAGSVAASSLTVVLHPSAQSSVAMTLVLGAACMVSMVVVVDWLTRRRVRMSQRLARFEDALQAAPHATDLAGTLSTVNGAIARDFHARLVRVLLREGDRLVVANAPLGDELFDDGAIARGTARELASLDASPIAVAVNLGETVVVPDIARDRRFPEYSRTWTRLMLPSGHLSLAVVPMRIRGEVIGCLLATFGRRYPLRHEQRHLLQAYAGQQALLVARARAHQELAEAERLRGELLGFVAHELRTPLAAAKGFVDTVLHQWDRLEDPQRRLMLERASAAADRMSELLAELLEYSRAEAGRTPLHRERVRVLAAVDGVLEDLAPVLARHESEVSVPADLVVEVDLDAFRHCLSNLVANAHRYSAPGSRIGVRAWRDHNDVVVAVTDEGVGIDAAEQPRVFEEFFQGRAGREQRRGVGLGLAIVRRLVELEGGRLWVDSAPGRGSTFSFTLLAADAVDSLRDPTTPAATAAPAPATTPATAGQP